MVAAAASTLAAVGRTFHNTTGSDASRPAGCSATTDPAHPLKVLVYFNILSGSSTACGAGAQAVAGAADSLVHVTVALDTINDTATITLAGPSAAWYGVGFGSSDMENTWAVVVDGTGAVTGEHGRPPPNCPELD